MQASATPTASDDVRGFIQESFDAWKGTDEQKILAYYSEDVVLDLPTGTSSRSIRFSSSLQDSMDSQSHSHRSCSVPWGFSHANHVPNLAHFTAPFGT